MTESEYITQYLSTKNLPLDLLVEVQDHMVEQVAEIISRDKISFENAFDQVKNLWAKDLKVQFHWMCGITPITSFENEIIKKNRKHNLCVTFLIQSVLWGITVVLILKQPSFAKYFMLSVYWLTMAVSTLLIIRYWKLVKTGYGLGSRKISVYQLDMPGLLIGVMYLVWFNLSIFDQLFGQMKIGVINLFVKNSFDANSFISMVGAYFIVWTTLIGILSLWHCKKSVNQLKLRVDLKI